jgi:dGTPase
MPAMSRTDPPVFSPSRWADYEDHVLAPYAMRTRASRGRRHPEPDHAYRSLYQRDRDRVVHSTAFRRLMYKTQVLVAQTNDHHRTRLTHTLEVAQISRTAARQLGLNEDLTEAIALSHDLGHPPFGHAGEAALAECLHDQGGFNHNLHGLRIVDVLEYRYPDFPGLNLSWEVLEAMAHHAKQPGAPEVGDFLDVGQPLLEAQLVDAADSLAYTCHDIDDALGVDLISFDDLEEVEFWRLVVARVRARHPHIAPERFRPTTIRALIDWQVNDLLTTTRERLQEAGINSVDDVRRAQELLVGPSEEVRALKAALESFLHRRVYRHYRVMRMTAKGQRIIKSLFEEFMRSPEQLPERYASRVPGTPLSRVVGDYLAGMTDRYAQDEYMRLFHPNSEV